MSCLHIVNQCDADGALASCLRLASTDSAILLIENAVYLARKNTLMELNFASIIDRQAVYVLEPDLWARGVLQDQLYEGLHLVNYIGFVELTVRYNRIVSWC